MIGAIAAAITLAAIVAIFGTAIVHYVPIEILRLIVGGILILFGLKWLKKAILRYSGLKALHDEEAIFEETMAEMRARGEDITQIQPTAVALSFKSVLLEGLEVAFIVITFGSNATSQSGIGGIGSAAIGAIVAGILIIALGALVRAPFKQIPENTLKFIVGIMLTSFGTFWMIEGFGVAWPFADAFIPILAAIYLLASFGFVAWLKSQQRSIVTPKVGSVRR
jgi:uncharacterized membrane protein